MTSIKIDQQRCTRNGRCIRICPVKLFQGDADTPTSCVPDAERLCIACGHCATACPTGAITLDGERTDTLESANPPLPTFADVRRLVLRRRSIRLYQQRLVPREEIARIIDATRWTPTARNNQQVHWIVVRQPERVREVAGQVVDFLRLKQEGDSVVAAWDKGIDLALRGAPHLVVAHGPAASPWSATDCVIALATFELLARAAGLGTCWAGFLTSAAAGQPAIAEALGVPEGHKLQGALMLGYPLSAFLRVPSRKTAKVQWVE